MCWQSGRRVRGGKAVPWTSSLILFTASRIIQLAHDTPYLAYKISISAPSSMDALKTRRSASENREDDTS